jgi:hypothetical protein
MDLSFLINNPILNNALVTGAVGTVATALGVGAYIAKWWKNSKYKKALGGGEEKLGNVNGLRLYKTLKSIIKDEAILKATIETLSEAPENFNFGWDAGLRGIAIGDPEYPSKEAL